MSLPHRLILVCQLSCEALDFLGPLDPQNGGTTVVQNVGTTKPALQRHIPDYQNPVKRLSDNSNFAIYHALPSPLFHLYSHMDHSYQRVRSSNPWIAPAYGLDGLWRMGKVGIHLWFTCFGYVFCFRSFTDVETSQQIALKRRWRRMRVSCLLNQKYLYLKFRLELLIGATGKLVNTVSVYKL
jgi:hypothetical protein